MLRRLCFLSLLLMSFSADGTCAAPSSPKAGEDVDGLISWLLADGRDLTGIRFSDVVEATAGVRVLPVDRDDGHDRRVLAEIGKAMNAMIAELNNSEHAIHDVGRINEVSGHLEKILLNKLNSIDGFRCALPPTADGSTQRSGYPDLRLVDKRSEQIFYLDPKLYAEGSERSSFRTFYFEPKNETNKILDDASHLIVGISHGGRADDGSWTFLRWNLVDLHAFEVRLKAEFQASNRDLYRPEAIVLEGDGPER